MPQVDEAGTGDVGRGDAVGGGQRGRPASRPARAGWRRPSCPAEGPGWWRSRRARGCAGRSTVTVAGSADGVEAVLGQHRGGGGLEQLSQVGGGHEGPSYGLGWSGPESFNRPLRCVRLCTPIGAAQSRVRPRSSGDRASASGAEGRRFDSCRGHHVLPAETPRIHNASSIPHHPQATTVFSGSISVVPNELDRYAGNWQS